MSLFFRLLADRDKEKSLLIMCNSFRQGEKQSSVFEVNSESFDVIPGKPFAYWVGSSVRDAFKKFSAFKNDNRTAWVGLQTNHDFEWLRLWWEAESNNKLTGLVPFFKGGSYSKYYSDIYLGVRWGESGYLLKEWKKSQLLLGKITENNSKCWNEKDYFRPGIVWPRRTSGLSFRLMPAGCIFADKGPAAFIENNDSAELFATSCLLNSDAFKLLVSAQLARVELAQSFEVGLIQQTPIPEINIEQLQKLSMLARRAWSLTRTLDTITETSHAFTLPAVLRSRQGDYDPFAIEAELASIQTQINRVSFELYEFSQADCLIALGGEMQESTNSSAIDADEVEEDDVETPSTDGLLSWAAGVAFGRFDWRLATGQRQAPPEPDPFDPLPVKSPGMLPDGNTPFHSHSGFLVDDLSSPHDLPRLIEQVLNTVGAPVAEDIRRWLQKDFFPFHLIRYSKSRRRAPIYWPLSTFSGSYTLWLDYSSLNDQTLFTAVNDFVDPKLEDVRKDLDTLRGKGTSRTQQEEIDLEALSILEHELADLRDNLLEIAPNYCPNHDDGVQITAAPLWKLFRHKLWQKALKDTWAKMGKGDYDWAHMAMNYWPDRVREKCVTDKSLAIAHSMEHLYIELEPEPTKARGRKKARSSE